ncbi:MAG: FAD-dependent oxidoreductase [Aliiglaciecola sp.]
MYDPLTDSHPEPKQGYPASYWASTIDTFPTPIELKQHIKTDIAIIGAGYTGLSAAYHLASRYGKDVIVVDANQPGWGCSGRNAGFVLPGTGRLSLLDMEQKWGQETAMGVFNEYMLSIKSVEEMISIGQIACDKTPGGYIKLAHRRAKVSALRDQAEKLNKRFGESVRYLHSKQVARDFMNSANMYGGIYFDKCFGVNPLKLALGYHRMAESAGAKVFSNSPVTKWQQVGNVHELTTPQGQVEAQQVIIATNGYTGKDLHETVDQRHFPVMSSIIVTRPLNENELASINMQEGLMGMDTRRMKYYYRLLPDNRILFGGRGAIKGKNANKASNQKRLIDGLEATFPALKHIDISHFWSGWVSATFDNYPRIHSVENQGIHYSMGYCGSGLAFSTLAGQRLAQSICQPESLPDLPFWQSPLPKFPFSSLKRVGLSAYYAVASVRN